MTITFQSTYATTGEWLKGNLHTHTTRSDGLGSPQDTINCYAAFGHNFLMLSDHDTLSNYDDVDACGMVLIPGNEISANGPHIHHIGASTRVEPFADRQKVLDGIQKDTGFAVCNHPNWRENYNHFPQELLESLTGYSGIEVVNGGCVYATGSRFATDRWDQLLTKGYQVWGHGSDDAHYLAHMNLGWNVVRSERTVDAIIHAMKTGNFYASTGVTINEVRVFGDCIGVESQNAQRFTVSTSTGREVFSCEGPNLFFRPTPEMIKLAQVGKKPYFRITAHGRPTEFAYLQPFYFE